MKKKTNEEILDNFKNVSFDDINKTLLDNAEEFNIFFDEQRRRKLKELEAMKDFWLIN